MKIFMIGAGAIGCEMLKCFALMGIGCSDKGKITVADNDRIELSNLNRQFLFRNKHIGKSKSKTATYQAKFINSQLRTKSFENLVSPDTEDVFRGSFWHSQDVVVNAVDNIKARLFIDSKCVWHKKPMLDSGTLGTKAHTQMIIPHLTECFSDSKDPKEESIPMCTLRNFPNQIEHCIEWGRNRFGELFTQKPADLRKFLEDKSEYLEKIQKESTDLTLIKELRMLREMLELKDFEDCVGFMKQRFYEDYYLQIKKLTELFPKKYKDETGNPFWSGPKRFPEAIEFDPENELHLDYVMSGANLLANCLGIEQNTDREEIEQMAEEAEINEEVEAEEVKLEDGEEKKISKKKTKKESKSEHGEKKQELLDELLGLGDLEQEDINPQEFDKDDTTNYHVDFIHAAANLRARNYKLKECDKFTSKMIAGKIVPALATTTATIVGAVCIELLKIAQKFEHTSDYRNTNINLAIPLFLQTEPAEPQKQKDVEMDPILMGPVKAIPPNWTIWDTIRVKGPLTVTQFMEEMKKKYKVEVTMISADEQAVYNSYINKDSMKERLNKKIEDIYDKISKKKADKKRKYLVLDVGGTNEGVDVNMPKILYKYK